MKLFVTGTDTGVGKTLTAAIMTYLTQGCYWKPIQSGIADEMADKETIQLLTGLPDQHFYPCHYALKASLSPHQAAALENIHIDLTQCKLPKTDKPLIVEGAGGIYAPLTQSTFMLDLIKQFQIPVVIVTRGTLGTLNHSLLTIHTLRQHDVPIKGVVICGDLLNATNQRDIEQMGKVRVLFHVPRFATLTPLILQDWMRKQKDQILESLLCD